MNDGPRFTREKILLVDDDHDNRDASDELCCKCHSAAARPVMVPQNL
jgi:hypothetical protein